MSRLRIGRRSIDTSNEDKVLFPKDGITKGDLIDYYRRVATVMLPHVRGRPLALHRYPDGIGDGFIQQKASDHFPDWVGRRTVKKSGGRITHAVCNDAATLVYLADQAVVSPHVWLSREDRLRAPDRMILDFDPPGDDFSAVRDAARAARGLLGSLGLESFVMTTGSSGLHVVVPLRRGPDFDTVRAFARGVAKRLAGEHPGSLTVEQRKSKRRGRVYVDAHRNAYGQTAVAPYAVRARAGAPVATPLGWDELSRTPDARRFTLRNLFRRLGGMDDPWKSIGRHAQSLSKPRRRLDAMGDDAEAGA